MSQRLTRLTTPVTGLIFVALMLISVSLSGSTPDSNASAGRVIAFYVAHRHDQQVSDITFTLAALFIVFFAGALYGYLRETQAAASAGAVMLVGAGLLAVGLTILAGTNWALADVPGRLSPAAAQALNVIGNDVFYTLPVGGAAFGIAGGVAILRGARLPGWLGWIAVVIGVALATPALWIAGVALFVWVLVVCSLVYVRGGAAAPTGV